MYFHIMSLLCITGAPNHSKSTIFLPPVLQIIVNASHDKYKQILHRGSPACAHMQLGHIGIYTRSPRAYIDGFQQAFTCI